MGRSRGALAAATIIAVAASCAGSDGSETSSLVPDDAPSAADETVESESGDDVAGQIDGVDANASVTLGDRTYGFVTEKCDINAADGDSATGVITIDGAPAYVEIGAFGGDGSVFLAVGLNGPTPRSEPFEETLERGVVAMWSLTFGPDDLTVFSDTEVRGSGTFLTTMSLDGSAGESLDGTFSAVCS